MANKPSTTAEFYPKHLNDNDNFNISPNMNQNKNRINEDSRSYNTIVRDQEENGDLSADKKSNKLKKQDITFKINPSPYKRKEFSIDNLMNRLNIQLNELEKGEARKLKKYLHALRSKKKHKKKSKKKKARSHSPQDGAVKLQRMMSMRSNFKINYLKSIQGGNMIDNKITQKKGGKGTNNSRNKRNNQSSIEGENRIMKVKTISNIKSQGIKKNKRKKSHVGKKKNSKKNSAIKFVKDFKQKMFKVIETKNDIYERAAVVIQRWYRY